MKDSQLNTSIEMLFSEDTAAQVVSLFKQVCREAVTDMDREQGLRSLPEAYLQIRNMAEDSGMSPTHVILMDEPEKGPAECEVTVPIEEFVRALNADWLHGAKVRVRGVCYSNK